MDTAHYRGVQTQVSDFGSGRFSKHNVKKERQRRRQRTRTRKQIEEKKNTNGEKKDVRSEGRSLIFRCSFNGI